MLFLAQLVIDSMHYKIQVDVSEVWFDALAEEISLPASPLEESLSPVRSPCDVAFASPIAENNGQSHRGPLLHRQHLLQLLVYMIVCQVTTSLIVSMARHPAAFVASIALMCLATAEPQQQAKVSAAAHHLARHAQHHAVHAWSAVSRSWCCCWSAAAALAALMWRLNAQSWLYVRSSAASRFAAVRTIGVSAWTSTAALWVAICHSSGRSWSYAQSRAASICTAFRRISQLTQTSSQQAAVSTGAAAQILCCTAWSILCHLLVITGAAVLTTGVIVLSTLLAAGFVAASMVSVAAAMCTLWFAAAAHKVTDTATAAVPVVKTIAASSLSAIWSSIGTAVQTFCYTAWSILCHLLVITGAAVLTTGVIVLSTLLAAGFVAASMVSVAAAMCKLWFATAALRVTDTATAAVPVVKTIAASSLSAIWRSIGTAVQILCCTAWSILRHLLVITGAAVLTTGVIVLSTLLAAGFVAACMMSLAAATCKVWFAAAAYRVTGIATAAVPVVKSTAASFLSACLRILTQRSLVTARAATQGSIAVAAASVHSDHAYRLKASQHIPSAMEAMWAACAKLQRAQHGLSMVAGMAPLLSSYAVYYAGSFESLLSTLLLSQLYSEGLQGHSKGLMLITGLHLCQHSLPDCHALGQLLLNKGPAMLGLLVSAICVLLCVGYYLSLAPGKSAASCNCVVRSLASTCDWALTGVSEVRVFLS